MFVVVLMVAAGITFGAYALSTPRDSSSLVLAIGILEVVLLNAVIGFAQEHAAERTAEALQALVPATARVIRDGELTEIPDARNCVFMGSCPRGCRPRCRQSRRWPRAATQAIRTPAGLGRTRAADPRPWSRSQSPDGCPRPRPGRLGRP